MADRVSSQKSFEFWAALRPFSLVVALVSCGLGVRLAEPQDVLHVALAGAVMVTGLLLQCGVNLINDRADLRLLSGSAQEVDSARRHIQSNFRTGLLCFAIAAVIGAAIAVLHETRVLAIGLIGVAGAYAYTQEPFNYKRLGLGVVFVFVLMGVLMMQGAYLAVRSEFALHVVWHSLPVSCLVSLLLLSNELRDYEQDARQGVRTLTVRIGFARAQRLYWALVVAAFALSAVLFWHGELPNVYWLLLPIPLLVVLAHYLRSRDRGPLTPWTGRFLLLFGIGYGLALS